MSTPTQSDAPDAFLFDLDGTLVDSERANVESVTASNLRSGSDSLCEVTAPASRRDSGRDIGPLYLRE